MVTRQTIKINLSNRSFYDNGEEMLVFKSDTHGNDHHALKSRLYFDYILRKAILFIRASDILSIIFLQ